MAIASQGNDQDVVTSSMPNTSSSAGRKSSSPDTDSTAIRMEDLNAWYGDFQALHSITLDVPRNQITAFIGPSGCGKSTLLRWINRMNDTILSARATGKLQMGELDLLHKNTDVVDLRRRVGIVFQKPNPF